MNININENTSIFSRRIKLNRDYRRATVIVNEVNTDDGALKGWDIDVIIPLRAGTIMDTFNRRVYRDLARNKTALMAIDSVIAEYEEENAE